MIAMSTPMSAGSPCFGRQKLLWRHFLCVFSLLSADRLKEKIIISFFEAKSSFNAVSFHLWKMSSIEEQVQSYEKSSSKIVLLRIAVALYFLSNRKKKGRKIMFHSLGKSIFGYVAILDLLMQFSKSWGQCIMWWFLFSQIWTDVLLSRRFPEQRDPVTPPPPLLFYPFLDCLPQYHLKCKQQFTKIEQKRILRVIDTNSCVARCWWEFDRKAKTVPNYLYYNTKLGRCIYDVYCWRASRPLIFSRVN